MSYNGKHPAQLAAELDSVVAEIARRSELGALSIGLHMDGSHHALAYGPGGVKLGQGPRPIFNIGCLMDLIVAVLCLDLHHRSGLDLDAPIEKFLPELRREDDSATVRVHHLLTRTSGLQDPRSIDEMNAGVPWDVLAARTRQTRRLFSPGTVFNYGGVDRIALGVLLERFSGRSMTAMAMETILRPLDVPLRDDQLGAAEADGLRPIERFDAPDFARIVAQLAREGEGSDNPFGRGLRYYLQGERLQLSRSMRMPPWPHAPMAFTLGLFKYSDGLIGFNGWDRGHACAARFDPIAATSFVVGLDGPPGLRDVIVSEIAERLGYGSMQSRASPCTVGGLNGLSPTEVAGVYDGWADGYRAVVAVESGALSCELSYRGEVFRQLQAALEEDVWLVMDSIADGSALEFFRDPASGRIGMASGYLPYAKA